ncbi:hypothetical protein [Cecembia lonarensis]|uniref:Uncharacterized protein n=1 Tax=Cecembia lonarensis (strain CCUG 58316 / KCTC 22772 / LW9) TaxID=1225176 RepID=K1LUL8_CECL9|nr:hypothetical protein [Cecembia lonarensis]EKB47804.1 hypothetical protein B879_03583 [Cecembia lonarensis LW9]
MKFLSYRLYLIFLPILLFGLVGEGYGQDCDVCKPNQNTRRSFIIQNVFLTDSDGERLGVDDCISGTKIWIKIEYTAQVTTYNLNILTDLLIAKNLLPENNRIEKIELFKSEVPRTTGNNLGTLEFEVDIPSGFNCNDENLTLTNTQAFWTANSTAVDNLCDYPPGLCNVFDQSFEVGVDGFLYNYDYLIECLIDEDGKFGVTFFITTLAGGDRSYEINWNIQRNGVLDNTGVNGGFSYTISNLESTDVISSDLEINSTPSDNPTDLEDIIIPDEILLFNYQREDDERTAEENPNGSITLEDGVLIPESYRFFWTSEDGTFISDEPELVGVEGGGYFLTVIDEDTGACRTYDLSISSRILPVIYKSIKLNYSETLRLVFFTWSTTKEWEASHFEIERASQGINFEKVGEVKAAGWSDQLTEYVFEDKMLPLTGGNLLYRLKQVDFNGDYHYSEVLSVRIPGMEFTQGVWRAFPNPTDGNALQVSLLDASQYNEEPITFRLIHPMMQTPALTVDSETAMNEALSGGLSRMPKGVFVVEVQWGQKIEHIKVLKKY